MIGIIAAMESEVKSLLNFFKVKDTKRVSGIKYYLGFLNNVSCVLAVSGVGKVSAAVCAQTMILEFSANLILNIGLAGSAHRKLKIGDIVVAKDTVQHDVDTSALGEPAGMVSNINLINIPCYEAGSEKLFNNILKNYEKKIFYGTIASADRFLCSELDLNKINENFCAIAVDMEAGSIAQVCYLNGVKFVCVKIISDSVFKEKTEFIKDYQNGKLILTKELCEIIYEVLPVLEDV